MLFAIVLAVAIQFLAPSFNEGVDRCTTGLIPLTDLASIRFYNTQHQLIHEEPAPGMEGQEVTVDLPTEGSVIITAVDTSGNESCETIWSPLSVPPESPTPVAKTVWFDVAGRRYTTRPKGPGIYIEVRGAKKRKIVLFR